jgi:hypothetical protein
MAYDQKFYAHMAYDPMIMSEAKIVMNVNVKMNTYKMSGLENRKINSLCILIISQDATVNSDLVMI